MTNIAVALFVLAALGAPDSQLVIGENVRVSSDDTPYVEPYVACHSASGRCIVAATKFSDSKPNTPVAFVSSDRGTTWKETRLPIGSPLEHAVDAWVAFTESGTAYATFLIIPQGESRTRIAIFRSDDGGTSWTHASTIAAERSFDRPTVIARGKEVAIAAEHRGAVAVLHSGDEGRTFGPARLFRASQNLDHNAMNPSWHGATLVVPFVDYGQALSGSRIATVATDNLGQSWATPVVVTDVPRPRPGNAHFAASGVSLYAAFASGAVESRTVSVASSTNGLQWREPVRVSNAGAQAFRPAIAVSSRGDIGTTWIETGSGCTRLWFAVSRDGGRTFAKPVPVSEELSCGNVPSNRAAYDLWEHGGDYYGLASQGESFVAVWPDARTGTFQIYAAVITVALTP